MSMMMLTKADKLEKQLRQWGVKLEALAAEAGKAGAEFNADVGVDYQKRVFELRFKYENIQNKLTEFKSSGDGKWADVKDEMKTLLKDLKVTFKGLTQRDKKK